MKNNVATMTDLAVKIRELEVTEAIQLASIKAQAYELSQRLKPSALIKTAFNDIIGSKNLQRNALDTSLGLGAGWVARKIFARNSTNMFRKMTGYILQLIITSLATKKIPRLREKMSDL